MVQEQPETSVIALSSFSNRAFVAEVLRAGARGYVVKQNAFDELVEAIQTAVSDSVYLCSNTRKVIVEDWAALGFDHRDLTGTTLTERERTVLRLLAEGRTSKEVALVLGLSSKTIDACRRQLMRKLNVDSVAGLVKCAIVMGMTTATPAAK